MTKEALKLALEALENTTPTGFNMERDKQFFEAITAIKEALAQPEQEPIGEVGTMPGTTGFTMACFKAEDVPVGTKLYTTSPAAQPAQEKCRVCGEGEATLMVIRECNKCGSEYAGKAEFDLSKAQSALVQDVDWKDMYKKEKRRSEMWVAKYEKDIGPLEYAVPLAAQRTWVGLTDA